VKWVVGALVAVLVLAGLALVWALPRLAKSEAARARIEAAAKAALGRELHYGEIDFALLPPSLLVEQPTVAGESAADPPLASAQRIALRLELWPLLRGQLEVASLAVDELALHLVRTADGLVLPKPEQQQTPPDAPRDREASEPSASGGGLEIRTVSLNDAVLVLEDRSAAPATTWRVEQVDLDAHSPRAGAPIEVKGSLEKASGGALDVAGAISLEAELASLADASGPFSIDASGARVAYGADFTKPEGTPAKLSGKLARDAAGAIGITDLVFELSNLVARGELQSAPRRELRIAAEAFALDGWEKLVPPLGVAPLRGRVAIPALALAFDPLSATGEIALDDLVVTPPERAPITLRGALELRGSALRTRDLVVRAADQPIRVDANVQSLFEAPRRYEVSFASDDADSNALLSSFSSQSDRLYGPLDLKGTLRGVVASEGSLLDALSGELGFEILKGRIAGASLIEVVLGSLGSSIAKAVRENAGPEWERFTRDEFDALRGTLTVANGQLVTAPVALVYPDWGAQLSGPIRLADLALDLEGTLTIGEALDAALARAFGAREGYVPQRREVKLTSVQGVLGDPKVQLAGSSATQLAAAYAASIHSEELKRRVEKELGEGSGELVDEGLKALEGLLGGGKKR
jgi:AsmA-like C-terminal region/AsmA family